MAHRAADECEGIRGIFGHVKNKSTFVFQESALIFMDVFFKAVIRRVS